MCGSWLYVRMEAVGQMRSCRFDVFRKRGWGPLDWNERNYDSHQCKTKSEKIWNAMNIVNLNDFSRCPLFKLVSKHKIIISVPMWWWQGEWNHYCAWKGHCLCRQARHLSCLWMLKAKMPFWCVYFLKWRIRQQAWGWIKVKPTTKMPPKKNHIFQSCMPKVKIDVLFQ